VAIARLDADPEDYASVLRVEGLIHLCVRNLCEAEAFLRLSRDICDTETIAPAAHAAILITSAAIAVTLQQTAFAADLLVRFRSLGNNDESSPILEAYLSVNVALLQEDFRMRRSTHDDCSNCAR